MKKIFFIALLAISCTKNDVQPKYTSLVGSWKLVTNNNVDLKFDIISDPTNPTILYMVNPYVGYKGQTSSLGAIVSFPLTKTNGLYSIDYAYDMGTYGNSATLTNIQQNSTLTVLTANSAWVSLGGYAVKIPSPDTLNLKHPIIINRVK